MRPRIVTLTKTYPLPDAPGDGPFIRYRMAAVASRLPVRVVHAVPWTRPLPPDDPGDVPPVTRVRYRYVPGILKGLDHLMLARSVSARLRALRRAGELDILDAHFGFPEGAAAVRLGRALGVPVAVTLRGTEKAFHGRGLRGVAMERALRRADLVIAVSRPLADLARRMRVEEERIRVIGNGADVELFSPGDRASARRRLGLPEAGPVLLSVGALIERKGHHYLLGMLNRIDIERPGVTLVIVGGGPWEGRLRRQAAELGVADRVRFTGLLQREQLAEYYRAADVLCLATSWEGWANVYFEAFASGIPVVTTDVGGAREAIPEPFLGTIVPFGEWQRFCDETIAALSVPWDGERIRRYATSNTWDGVGRRVAEAFAELCGRRKDTE